MRRLRGAQRRRVFSFCGIDIGIYYPSADEPVVSAEVKALGPRPHLKNGYKARGARSDLHKRVREVAFTATDVKAAHARPTLINSFQDWIDKTRHAYLTFWAMRVAGPKDLDAVRSFLSSLKSYCNGVGAASYEAKTTLTDYVVRDYPEFDMDRVIRDFTQRVISSRGS